MGKSLIGITASNISIAINFSNCREISFVPSDYLKIIQDYGAIPLILPSVEGTEVYEEVFERLDGLILSGGQDINSSLYGEQSQVNYDVSINGVGEKWHRPIKLKPDNIRDKSELAMYYCAKNRNIPILGICRGMQIINVAEGGSLNQEIPDSRIKHNIDNDGWINYHEIAIDPSSKIYACMQTKHYCTSSLHHQSVKVLGKNLFCAATAPDGVVEILENNSDDNFVIGIQGHPEKTRTNFVLYERIYTAFFNACSDK